MGLYNFQPRFVDHILAGKKTHTIRAARKIVDSPGKTMHLFTGLRQKGARLLFRAPCVKRESIQIEFAAGIFMISIDGQVLDREERELLAMRDGFSSFADMMQFWTGRLPFAGHVFHWDFSKRILR
jgi:hypothetical protein